MTQQISRELLKPRITRCGTHWNVEWNRKGDFYPQGTCTRDWEEAIKIGIQAVKDGRVAVEVRHE